LSDNTGPCLAILTMQQTVERALEAMDEGLVGVLILIAGASIAGAASTVFGGLLVPSTFTTDELGYCAIRTRIDALWIWFSFGISLATLGVIYRSKGKSGVTLPAGRWNTPGRQRHERVRTPNSGNAKSDILGNLESSAIHACTPA
jgi:hypothetical protein